MQQLFVHEFAHAGNSIRHIIKGEQIAHEFSLQIRSDGSLPEVAALSFAIARTQLALDEHHQLLQVFQSLYTAELGHVASGCGVSELPSLSDLAVILAGLRDELAIFEKEIENERAERKSFHGR